MQLHLVRTDPEEFPSLDQKQSGQSYGDFWLLQYALSPSLDCGYLQSRSGCNTYHPHPPPDHRCENWQRVQKDCSGVELHRTKDLKFDCRCSSGYFESCAPCETCFCSGCCDVSMQARTQH